ncbi:MAG: biotin--[acetyl-CoA-carboxylase] ligase [Hyphomicrobiaceae bacterium]|nr:biotin--[acetyl-CoA-carboxylase] ligase [Hyphomicrobiaceae bacterium]
MGAVSSTIDAAWDLLAAGEEAPFWIVADSQSAGRGRRGRGWESPPGNLYTALALDAAPLGKAAPLLSLALSTAVACALNGLFQGRAGAQVKWPNDVLIDGAKISGLLIERRQETGGDRMVVGLGINVASHPALEDRKTAALKAFAPQIGVDELFQSLSPLVEHAVRLCVQGEIAAIREEWMALAAGLGSMIEVRLPETTLRGRHGGLNGDGTLNLLTDLGPVAVAAGDVFL